MSQVNHPSHYNQTNFECIELVRYMSFNLGNAVKYLWRYQDKANPIEDLEKALWYIDDEIKHKSKVEYFEPELKPAALKALKSLASQSNYHAIKEIYFAHYSTLHKYRALVTAKKQIRLLIKSEEEANENN